MKVTVSEDDGEVLEVYSTTETGSGLATHSLGHRRRVIAALSDAAELAELGLNEWSEQEEEEGSK